MFIIAKCINEIYEIKVSSNQSFIFRYFFSFRNSYVINTRDKPKNSFNSFLSENVNIFEKKQLYGSEFNGVVFAVERCCNFPLITIINVSLIKVKEVKHFFVETY